MNALRKKGIVAYVNGKGGCRAAAEKVGVSHQTILNWAREAGIPILPQGARAHSLRERVQIADAVKKGTAMTEIKASFGIEKATTVKSIVKWVESVRPFLRKRSA